MRTLALLALLILLAGCSDSPAADSGAQEEATPPDDDRVARRGGHDGNEDEDAEDWPHKDVVLLSEPIQAVGVQPVTFEVDIPADTTNISFMIESAALMVITDLSVDLEGCGAFGNGGLVGSISIIGGSYSDWICEQPTVGHHTVTVQNTGILVGKFELHGQQPLPADPTGGTASAAQR